MTSEEQAAAQTPEHVQQEAPAAPTEAPQKAPEQVTLQVVYSKYDDGQVLYREGVPSQDAQALSDRLIALLQKPEVREAFLVTVHAAYVKEVNIKKVI